MVWTDEKRARQARGHCASCDALRGSAGTSWLCRPCADRKREIEAERRLAVVKSGACIACRKRRGRDGTSLRCRPCAQRNARAVRKAQIKGASKC